MWNEESRKGAQFKLKKKKWLWHTKLVQILIEDPTLMVKSRHQISRIRARLKENGLDVCRNTVVTMCQKLKVDKCQTIGERQYTILKSLKPKPYKKNEI